MMKSIATRAARRTLLPLRSTTAVFITRNNSTAVKAFFGTSSWVHHKDEPPHINKFTSAHVDADIPEADYYKGHLMADHLEYLDDVLEKTVELEESVQALHETHEKKQAAYSTIKWTDSSEIDALFQDAAAKKEAMKRHIEELKAIVQTAKQRAFAVDAPDGMPDGFQHEEMREIKRIISEAALHEDGDAILQQRAADAENRKVLGVDAPDGVPDGADYEDLEQTRLIIEKAAELKELILEQRELDRENRRVLAVDAPDGTPDGLNKEELLAIKYIIDEAAKREDGAKVEYMHKMQDKVRVDRARDPEHDW